MKANHAMIVCFMLIFVAPSIVCEDTPPIPDSASISSMLFREHPRLMLNNESLENLKVLPVNDPTAAKYLKDVMKAADAICGEPVLSYTVGEDQRLLSVSRRCMERMYTLGLAWRLTGEKKYVAKAEEDLLAVCSFENWTPSLVIIYPLQEKNRQFENEHGRPPFSFLDVAEMCHAVGIGYDWFFHYLSPESRERMKAALIEKGLRLGVSVYAGTGAAAGSQDNWPTYNHNWNMVCNGGLIIGALAIAESDPRYAETIIPSAVQSLPIALRTYGPDGAWPEGPSYWGYATSYTVFALSALKSALGNDFGLSEIEGLSKTGYFPILTTGPTGYYLNFADSREKNRRESIPCLFYLSRRYDNPFFSDYEHEMAARHGADPLHLIWYVPPSKKPASPHELDTYFRGPTEIAVLRSDQQDPEGLFVGMKAGDNTFNHAHLDLGTFELDALGVRWVRDLGSDSYSLAGYFDFYYLTGNTGGERWSYYRNSSLSHNVPVLNGINQNELAKASFDSFISNPSSAHAIVDLTEAYNMRAGRAKRGIATVNDRRAILVQDEFELTTPTDVAWGVTTDADIAIDGSRAVLTQQGKTLSAAIIEPAGTSFTIESAEQAPPQNKNEGAKRLMVRLPKVNGSIRIAVLLAPHWGGKEPSTEVKVTSLSEW